MGRVVMIFGVFVILTIYAGANYFVARKLYEWLLFMFPYLNKRIYIGIYIFLAFSIFLVFLPLPSAVKYFINWLYAHWMGIFIYLFVFTLIANMLLFIGRLVKLIPQPVPEQVFFFTGLTVALLTFSFVTYGLYNGTKIKQVSYDIYLEEKPISEEMKLVFISDIHLGAINSEQRIKDIVEKINEQEPHIVCIVGDIFNDNFDAIKNHDEVMELLKSIDATYGVYASLGNHDGGTTFDKMIDFLEKSNIAILQDEHVIINDELILIGRLDPSPIGGYGGLQRKDIEEVLNVIEDRDLPIVVMDHTPSNLEQYKGVADLVISGHTHKGQIFPGNLFTNILFEVDYGYYRKNAANPHVVVSSGAGTWGMPMRVGSNNEVVSIHLQ